MRPRTVATSLVLAAMVATASSGRGQDQIHGPPPLRNPHHLPLHGPQTCFLELTSRPLSIASVDGEGVGSTPFRLVVRCGEHRVELFDLLGPGPCRVYALTVRASPTMGVHVDYDLRELQPVRECDASGADLPLDPTVPAMCVLQVWTRPWTHVSVDGRALGNTPVHQAVLCGRHRLQLRTDDGALCSDYTQTVEVTRRTSTFRIELDGLRPTRRAYRCGPTP